MEIMVIFFHINFSTFKRNGIHPDVFNDMIEELHQSNTSYLF